MIELPLTLTLSDDQLDAIAERVAAKLAPVAMRYEARPAAYTVATLAQETGLSTRAIRGAIERGELPAVKRGRRWLIDASAVAAWIEPSPPAPVPAAPSRARRRRPSGGTLASVVQRIADDDGVGAADDCARPPVRLSSHTQYVTPATRQRHRGPAKGDTTSRDQH